jgi:protein subunit release factor A
MSGSKSQHKNKDKAFGVLRSRLYEQELAKTSWRCYKTYSQVSSGDRSNKIRTYNYAQGRVTDHRVGLTLYDLGNHEWWYSENCWWTSISQQHGKIKRSKRSF